MPVIFLPTESANALLVACKAAADAQAALAAAQCMVIFPGLDCQKPRRVCAAHGANKVQFVFSGGVYVGKNSSRPASVEFLCRRRRNYARSRVQAPQPRAQQSGSRLRAWQKYFFDKLYRMSPLSFSRSSRSVPLTFFKTILSSSFSPKESFASFRGFLSMA